MFVSVFNAFQQLWPERSIWFAQRRIADAPAGMVEHEAVIEGFAPRRRSEFLSGRMAAAAALSRAGAQNTRIARLSSGAPSWPSGWTGSISHDREHAVAAVGREPAGIGIDVENLCRYETAEAARRLCLSEAECARLGDTQARVIRIFSVKEAVFKALAPQIPDRFWLPDIELVPEEESAGTYRWRIAKAGLDGVAAFREDGGRVVSLCVVEM